MQPAPVDVPVADRLNVKCANCNEYGHIYRSCNHPVLSYGVICFRREKGTEEPRYLLIQRHHTFAYVDFVRGRYDIDNRDYILDLFRSMTPEERARLADTTFEAEWRRVWCVPVKPGDKRNGSKRAAEHSTAKRKWAIMQKGYYIRRDNDELDFFGIKECLDLTESATSDPGWGFPKGRRNINEPDIKTAMREFTEETGIPTDFIMTLSFKPFEETFTGSNGTRYRHVYFIAKMAKNSAPVPNAEEVRCAAWLTYDEAQACIREHVERVEMFRRVDRYVRANIDFGDTRGTGCEPEEFVCERIKSNAGDSTSPRFYGSRNIDRAWVRDVPPLEIRDG